MSRIIIRGNEIVVADRELLYNDLKKYITEYGFVLTLDPAAYPVPAAILQPGGHKIVHRYVKNTVGILIRPNGDIFSIKHNTDMSQRVIYLSQVDPEPFTSMSTYLAAQKIADVFNVAIGTGVATPTMDEYLAVSEGICGTHREHHQVLHLDTIIELLQDVEVIPFPRLVCDFGMKATTIRRTQFGHYEE